MRLRHAAGVPLVLPRHGGLRRPARRPACAGPSRSASPCRAGSSLVFGVMGILITQFSVTIQDKLPWVTIVIGIGLVALGIAMVRGFEPVLNLPKLQKGTGSRQLWSMFLFGVSYAVSSLSCTIPLFLVVVAGTFTRSSFAEGMADVPRLRAGHGARADGAHPGHRPGPPGPGAVAAPRAAATSTASPARCWSSPGPTWRTTGGTRSRCSPPDRTRADPPAPSSPGTARSRSGSTAPAPCASVWCWGGIVFAAGRRLGLALDARSRPPLTSHGDQGRTRSTFSASRWMCSRSSMSRTWR